MVVEDLIIKVASQGLLGVLLVIAFIGYYRKDQKCTELQDLRLKDMVVVKDQYTGLITTINSTLDKLVAHIKASR